VPRSSAILGLLAAMALAGQVEETRAQSVAAERASADMRFQRFDDWVLRCVMPVKSGDGTPGRPACEIAQPLTVEQDGRHVEVLNLAVSRASDIAGKADWALVALAPLDVQLASDFGFSAGPGEPSLVRYRNCNRMGCFVIVPLDPGRIAEMKRAAEGAAFFRLLNGQTIKVTFSLKGFTRAFDALASGTLPAETQGDNPSPAAPPSGEAGK
jgi:invasion protein IalB